MNNRGTNTRYLVLALLAVIATTLTVFGLVGDGFVEISNRALISLSSLILAELITFSYAIYCSASHGNDQSRLTFPFEFTGFGMLLLYDVSVAFVVLLSFSSVSDAWLISLQLMVLLGITLGMLMMAMGKGYVASQEIVESRNRDAFFLLADDAKSIAELAHRLDHESWAETCAKVEELCEQFEYACGESLSGAELVDEKVASQLKILHGVLNTCPVEATEEWVVQVEVAIRAVGASVRDRETFMQRLRNHPTSVS